MISSIITVIITSDKMSSIGVEAFDARTERTRYSVRSTLLNHIIYWIEDIFHNRDFYEKV